MKYFARNMILLGMTVMLCGCAAHARSGETVPTTTAAVQTQESSLPVTEETIPVRESVQETEAASVTQPTVPGLPQFRVPEHYPETTHPPETDPPEEEVVATPEAGKSKSSTPEGPPPKPTEPSPAEDSRPKETIPPDTTPPETVPEETEPPVTEPMEETPVQPSESFKQEVADAAVKYLNRYREQSGVQSCTILPGMTLVAEYRADQLTRNFSHSTRDKREALAYYRYGRYVDATLAGLEESDSYYEADSAEAICAGFRGQDAEAMGRYIADQIRNSGSHWRNIGSAEYSYIGVGVEYREGSEYGWYACVMVGMVDYG